MSQKRSRREQKAQAAPGPFAYVYLLECADGTLYCGKARNITRRLRQHNGEIAGGAKYTRSRRPVRLACVEGPYQDQRAYSRELDIKEMNRAEKLRLVEQWRSGDGQPLPPVAALEC